MYGQIPFNGVTNIAGKASLLSKINFSSLLTNTQKVLNVINQAVPLYYQTKPIIKNIKSISKIGKEISKINNNPQTNISNTKKSENTLTSNIPEPIFFI